MTRPQTRALSEQLDVVANVLREGRQEAGLSQRSMAQRLGKANSHVSKIESGLRRVDALELYRIADALGLPPLTLFERVALLSIVVSSLMTVLVLTSDRSGSAEIAAPAAGSSR